MIERVSLSVDVVIVGAGIVGCAIARKLSMHDTRVLVLEGRHDVGCGAAGANSGITGSGWSEPNGSIESQLIVASNPRWEEISEQLGVPFKRVGGVVLARNEAEAELIPGRIKHAEANGVRVVELDTSEVQRLAPYATRDVTGGILIPSEGVIDSPQLTVAFAQLAAMNGVHFYFGEPFTAARRIKSVVTEVYTPHLRVSTKFVVNASGLGADVVSHLMGCEDFQMVARRGEYLVFDREIGKNVTHVLHPMPSPTAHGLMVTPTATGGLLVGPTSDDIEDKTDTATHRDTLGDVLAEGRTLMPALDERHVIKSYAGNRPHSEDRLYWIGPSTSASNVVQVVGIRSIGVSASPALADYVYGLLIEQGLTAPVRPDARQRLDRRPSLAETLDCDAAARDPLGRTIVCACEKVTAAEIHAALGGPLPARSISGIARRTRATCGRCQGTTCAVGVAFIASLYWQQDAWALPMGEPQATLGVGKARHV